MPKQLILLAGLHKTATTSIQRSCAANQKALFKAGYAYPTLSGPGEAGHANHTALLNWFRRDPSRAGLLGQFRWNNVDMRQRETVLAEFAGSMEKLPADMVLAAEGVSLFGAEELTAMKDWFGHRGWEIRIVCHVRHLGSWIHSMIAQRVTSGIALSIAAAVDEYRQYRGIVRRRIETMRQVFPEAEFYSHEAAVRHPSGPVGFFLHNAGIVVAGPVRYVRANEGSSDAATRLVSVVNEKFGRFDAASSSNPAFFDNQGFIDGAKAIGGRKFTLRPAEAAPIVPLLQADNEWLKESLGDQFHDPNIAFVEREPDWTPEALAQAARVIATLPPRVRDWVHSNRSRLGMPPP